MLKGKRTYIVCALGIIWAIVGIIFGWLEEITAINVILASLGGAGLRAGLPK